VCVREMAKTRRFVLDPDIEKLKSSLGKWITYKDKRHFLIGFNIERENGALIEWSGRGDIWVKASECTPDDD